MNNENNLAHGEKHSEIDVDAGSIPAASTNAIESENIRRNIMTFANILGSSTDFWGAFLNVLGIIGLILIAVFLVVFVSDWILSTMTGNEGIFFKKNKNNSQVTNNTTNITNNYADREPVIENDVKEEDVDFEKARQEEQLIEDMQKQPVFEPETADEPEFEDEPEVQEEVIEPDYDSMIDEINDDSLFTFDKMKKEELAQQALQSEDEMDDEDEKDVIEEDFSDLDLDEDDAEEVEIDDSKDSEEPKEEQKVVEEGEQSEEMKQIQNEILQRLEQQISDLQMQLSEQQKENEELKRMAEEEKAKLNALIAKRNGDDDSDGRKMKDYVGNLDELELRLENLKERLKANEKELRINKKEYIPLARVKKTLESDKKKLRRREAIVAKRKVLLYGVNNYADIDEEKAKELNEELDLLEGLRLSVAHCEEVMEANKDRYPILEHTNKILTETNVQIKEDIEQVEKDIEQAKKMQEENQD